MFEIFKYRSVHHFCYVVLAMGATDIIYLGYKYALNTFFHKDLPEVNEVLWTNELTQSCCNNHKMEAMKARAAAIKAGDLSLLKCYNPFCAENNIMRMLELIDSARYTIDLAMYTFSSIRISDGFERAVKRGLTVRIITDKEMIGASGSQVRNLSEMGAKACAPNTRLLMHHKFCIIDGPKSASSAKPDYDPKNSRGLLMSGSLNWTNQGLCYNWENIMITSHKELVEHYEREFERMWAEYHMCGVPPRTLRD